VVKPNIYREEGDIIEVLSLNNEYIANPYLYCKLHKCFLSEHQYKFKQCSSKGCHHYKILTGNEDISTYETQIFDKEKEWYRKFSTKPVYASNKYESNLRKKNYSIVGVLKQKAAEESKQKQKYNWYGDLDIYYKDKYNMN
jgi:hypothetical protein